METPDDLIYERVRGELIDKCRKRYAGADHVWLCLHEEAPLSNRASVAECAGLLHRHVPRTHGFEAIYLTYTGSMDECDDVKVFCLVGDPAWTTRRQTTRRNRL